MNIVDRFMITTYFIFLLSLISTISKIDINGGDLLLIFIISLGFSVAWSIWSGLAEED